MREISFEASVFALQDRERLVFCASLSPPQLRIPSCDITSAVFQTAAQVLLKFHCAAQRGSYNYRLNTRTLTGPRGGKKCIAVPSACTVYIDTDIKKSRAFSLRKKKKHVACDCIWHHCPFPSLPAENAPHIRIPLFCPSLFLLFSWCLGGGPLICHLHIGGGPSLPSASRALPKRRGPAWRKVSL